MFVPEKNFAKIKFPTTSIIATKNKKKKGQTICIKRSKYLDDGFYRGQKCDSFLWRRRWRLQASRRRCNDDGIKDPISYFLLQTYIFFIVVQPLLKQALFLAPLSWPPWVLFFNFLLSSKVLNQASDATNYQDWFFPIIQFGATKLSSRLKQVLRRYIPGSFDGTSVCRLATQNHSWWQTCPT